MQNRYLLKYYQCLADPEELSVMMFIFELTEDEIAERLIWLVSNCVKECLNSLILLISYRIS